MKPGYFDHTPKVKVDDGNTIVLPVQVKSNPITGLERDHHENLIVVVFIYLLKK
jgi:hypothetical protein